MEIKTNPTRTSKGYFFSAGHHKGVSHHHLRFGEDSKVDQVGSLLREEGNGFGRVLREAVGTGEQQAANSEQGIQVMAQGYIFGFSGPLLNWTQGQMLEVLLVVHVVLTIWGQLLQTLLFGFLNHC